MDTVKVSDKDSFVGRVMDFCDEQNDGTDVSAAAAEEMWEVWAEYGDHKPDAHCILIPFWLSEDKFGARRPFVLAEPEYDNSDKAAVLWKETHVVDKNVLEAQMWNDVEIGEVLEEFDGSEDPDSYVDEPGLTWTPRSQHLVLEYDGGNQ